MSVLPVVIDMEYVISFINSEISRGGGGGCRQRLRPRPRLGRLQTETAGYTYKPHHTHSIYSVHPDCQMKSKSTIRLRRSTFSIRRFLSGNCVDDRKDPPPLICLTIWPCAQPASLLSVSEVVPILTQSSLGLPLASVTIIPALDWSAASTLLTGHSFPQHLPAVASYCQSVLPQPPAQPGPLPILVSVCCDCPNTATALESAAISSVYLQSEIIKIQDL